MRDRLLPAIGLLLLIAIGACGLAFSSPPPEIREQANPESDGKAEAEPKTPDERIADFTEQLALFTGVVGGATILLFIATSLLWWETKKGGETNAKIARAADLSARAAVRLELPVVLCETPPELLDLGAPRPEVGPYAGGVEELAPGPFTTVDSIELSNWGRTTAILQTVKIGWEAAAELPAIPTYRHQRETHRGETLIEKSSGMSVDLPRYTILLNQAQVDGIIAKDIRLWFFVEITYADFMGDGHVARFCWQWGSPEGVGAHYFAAIGNPPRAYTRHT